ncbi:pantoate--beta-alanine ligase [Flavobacterium aquicola]|uniref:Pantothenate synthetase n=1 Tax=Flavobacterium aquicola TaxID=1682742 RepID=A0A3E0E0L1_9FLAO|nr:pantoate--beta-alanine ligase [Flavobacterium aquicola]REG91180.1 pantothenate synthetase [Flavobacterium aquicola]
MQIFDGKTALMDYLRSIKTTNSSIGFVPTMGALHKGHQSLMKQSVQENGITVVSIFVNPTQFNNPEDLEKYPRTLDQDIIKISQINPDIIVFAPTVEDIYEGKTLSQSFDFDGLENKMEGKFRPGHFDGVGTIVKKLFEIVQPTNAYFGEKDFQQVQIVKKMVEKSHLPVTIIMCPILRETNNLAMSSRNERLTLQDRMDAGIIYEILTGAKEKFANSSVKETTQWVENEFNKNKKFTLEYFEIADEDTLTTCDIKIKNKKYRAFIAVFISNVRLIDTISLN